MGDEQTGTPTTAEPTLGMVAAPLTRRAADIVADARLVQEVMTALFKEDIHYGRIPGCGDKPTLYKPGAEKIASVFRLAITPVVTDLSTPDEIRYRVEARAVNWITGAYAGSGIGECSTRETKYQWRAALGREYSLTPADRKRVKFGKARDGSQDTEQVRTEPADLANTVLKMAKKRALVDCVLTVTAASDCFTQDIEDLPEEIRPKAEDENQDPPKAPVQPPKRKTATAAPATAEKPTPAAKNGTQNAIGPIEDILNSSGKHGDGTPWTRWGVKVGGTVYGTFSSTLAAEAKRLQTVGAPVCLTWQQAGEHRNIVGICDAESEFALDG